jgi:hypothetical protein
MKLFTNGKYLLWLLTDKKNGDLDLIFPFEWHHK